MWKKVGTAAAAYAALSAYYRYRPQPDGINGRRQSYRVPAEEITFLYDATWYEAEPRRNTRRNICQILPAYLALIRQARAFVLMDVFLFNLHHVRDGRFPPLTRQVAEALADKAHPAYFITDPLNTSYGTEYSEPLRWLAQGGVEVCVTDLNRLRDNNLLYSPFWRLCLQWFGDRQALLLDNPLRQGRKTTPGAVLMALNAKGNHRKVALADDGDEAHVAMIASANLQDAGAFFHNTALRIRSSAVARHFLAAERAVARMSGCNVPVEIPAAPAGGAPSAGDAEVTPLMGAQIKASVLQDLRGAREGDALYVYMLFLSDRDVIRAIKRAARRGVRTTVVLDRNRVSFGQPKNGFPNQFVAAELARAPGVEVRWANTRGEEFHTKLLIRQSGQQCIIHTGSANFTRRSLSNTNLEANVRVAAPTEAPACRAALAYARWMAEAPRSLPAHGDAGLLKYGWYRFIEATGTATF